MQATVPSLLLAALCLLSPALLAHGFVLTSSQSTIPLPTPATALVAQPPCSSPPTPGPAATGPAPEATTPGPQAGAATAPAAADDVADRFRQTTYWTCVRWPGVATAHCGWQEPILDASMPNAAAGGRGRRGGPGGLPVVVGACGVAWCLVCAVGLF